MSIGSITVFCAASTTLAPEFHDDAHALGRDLAARGLTLVYGGGGIGLMGEVARACSEAGGRVVGIITAHLMTLEQGWDGCDEMIVVDSMRERKRLLTERGDAVVVLPGGLGTYEEMFEIIVGRILREHDKRIGIVNCHGYFNPLEAMIQHGIEHRFINPNVHEAFRISPDADAILEWVVTGRDVCPREP